MARAIDTAAFTDLRSARLPAAWPHTIHTPDNLSSQMAVVD